MYISKYHKNQLLVYIFALSSLFFAPSKAQNIQTKLKWEYGFLILTTGAVSSAEFNTSKSHNYSRTIEGLAEQLGAQLTPGETALEFIQKIVTMGYVVS